MGKINASHSTYCYDSVLKRSDDKYLRSCSATADAPIDEVGRNHLTNEAHMRADNGGSCTRSSHKPQLALQWCKESYEDDDVDDDDDDDDDNDCVNNIDERHGADQQHHLQDNGVERIDEHRLVYRAEGNANIVLSLSDNKHVLRMRKSTIVTRDGKVETNVDLRRFVKYSLVISQQFSSCYVPTPKLAHLNTYNLQAFNEQLRRFRPATRLGKEIRELDGILYPDVAFLPKWLYPTSVRDFSQECKISTITPTHFQTYCVEIKPKQGWFSYEFCDNIPFPELANGDLRKCRYCLHQYLKLQKKSIAKISKYCPLDLYSGKPIRVLHAVKGLIGAPQNNFKILKNGKVVYDDKREKSIFNRILKEMFPRDGRTKEERKTIFMNLIKEILLKDFSTNDENTDRKLLTIRKDRKKKDKNQLHERACNPVSQPFLTESCALRQILDVQLLAKSSIQLLGASKFGKASSTSSSSSSSSSSPSSSDPYGYIDEMYEKYLDYKDDAMYGSNSSNSSSSTSSNANTWPIHGADEKSKLFCTEYLSEKEQYQLGATALDCSIMITFRRLVGDRAEEDSLSDAARKHIVTIEGMRFMVNVTITDLDPKSHKHYAKYVDQLASSVVAYRDFMSKLRR
uniref:Inositol-pentakisphosphate 2-kinase n=1 Tax=Anopheles atroparvus TaxID=41427 RepID=A0AAG5DHH5_ANOAO